MTQEEIAERNPEAILIDGLDKAIIGMARRVGMEVVAYDYDKCVEVLMEREDWDREDAIDWMEYNVVGAFMGACTPVFVDLSIPR